MNADNVDEIIARQADEASRKAWFQSVVDEQFADMDSHVSELGN